jgi:predicted Na+-dependent transporter
MTGTLEVHAYADGEEVAAELEIVNVGKYYTPLTITLPEGTYILIAYWLGQYQIKPATVETDKTTTINFYFEKPSLALAYLLIASSFLSLIISVIGLWLTVTRKKP